MKFSALLKTFTIWGTLFYFLAGANWRCARVGAPSGGDKDTIPPRVIAEIPPSGTVNFSGDKIIIKFDEFITLDNPLNKITFSPPLERPPKIKPAGYPSKKIEIKFQSPLPPSTTFTIHFNDAIKDYHEGNILSGYTYVFSTGPHLDSLTLNGEVKPAYDFDLPEKIIVGLYRVEDFTDSLVYNGKPYFMTRASGTGDFKFTHLPAGKFFIIAFSDPNGSLNYQKGEEFIGFLNKPVEVPHDSVVRLMLFREPAQLDISALTQKTFHKWSATYSGDTHGTEVFTPGKTNLFYFTPKTLDIWIHPVRKGDSIRFLIIRHGDTVYHSRQTVREAPADTLMFRFSTPTPYPLDTVWLYPTIPIVRIDTARIKIEPATSYEIILASGGKAGLRIPFDPSVTSRTWTLLPGAVQSFTGSANTDTLRHQIRYIPPQKTGHLKVTFTPPLHGNGFIVQLLDAKQTVRRLQYFRDSLSVIEFPYLPPDKYHLRIIDDRNANGRYDSGDFSRRIQPEKVYKHPKIIEIRPNWYIEENWLLPLD